CLSDRDRPLTLILTAANDGASLVLGLPEVEDAGTIGVLVVVGCADCPDPVRAAAGRAASVPGAHGLVAPVAEADAGRDEDEVRLAPDGEAHPGGPGLEGRRALMTRHDPVRGVPICVPWTGL